MFFFVCRSKHQRQLCKLENIQRDASLSDEEKSIWFHSTREFLRQQQGFRCRFINSASFSVIICFAQLGNFPATQKEILQSFLLQPPKR